MKKFIIFALFLGCCLLTLSEGVLLSSYCYPAFVKAIYIPTVAIFCSNLDRHNFLYIYVYYFASKRLVLLSESQRVRHFLNHRYQF